jgi:outer membrane receptor protein involved in Fe transport
MKKLDKKLLPRQIALLLAAAAPSAAWAQATSTPDAADDSQALGTIIVTAEKRSEDIQEVPMSISVIGEDELENLHATQLTDFAGYIPGFIVQDGGAPGQATLALRGIPPISAGSTVATYIDETPLGSSSNYGAGSSIILDLLPYDFQSFEVLRGPQGTLYGATSLGGLVRYTTKAPDADRAFGTFGADVSNEQCGRRGLRRARLVQSAALARQARTDRERRASGHSGFHRQRSHGREGSEFGEPRCGPRRASLDAEYRSRGHAAGDHAAYRFRQLIGRRARSRYARADLRQVQG